MSPKLFTRTNVSMAIIGLSLILLMLVAGGCAYVRRGETSDAAWDQYTKGLEYELRKNRLADVPTPPRN